MLVFKRLRIATAHRVGNGRERTVRDADRHHARVGECGMHHTARGLGRHDVKIGVHEFRAPHDIVFRIRVRIQHEAAPKHFARSHNDGEIHVIGSANGNGARLRYAARIAPIAGKRVRAVVGLAIGDARRHAHGHALRAIRLIAIANSAGKRGLAPRGRKGLCRRAAHNSSEHRRHNLRSTQDPRDEAPRRLLREHFSEKSHEP